MRTIWWKNFRGNPLTLAPTSALPRHPQPEKLPQKPMISLVPSPTLPSHLAVGMEEKSKEFANSGSEVYVPA